MVPVGEKMLDQLTEATELHIEQYEVLALITSVIIFRVIIISILIRYLFDYTKALII